MNLLDIVLAAKNSNASDIHITSGSPIQFRIDGIMTVSNLPVLTANELRSILESTVPDRLKTKYYGGTDVDFAVTIEGVARLRCNLYHSFDRESAAIRLLPTRVIDKNELNLPEQLVEFSNLTKGLVLITGATGCGKSTTLAALLNEINKNHSKHIVTLEDPVEYIHEDINSVIHHREIGRDVSSFAEGMRTVLRQDPDVILIGEMRDLETMSTAIAAAEAGHLVFATLHTSNSTSSVDRIINAFPGNERQQIRIQLADTLKGVASQLLLPKISGGRIASFELLLVNQAAQSLIRDEKTYQLPAVIQSGKSNGMFFMDDSLIKLYQDGFISENTVEIYANNLRNVKERLKPTATRISRKKPKNMFKEGAVKNDKGE